jgi:hypothetical protein
MHSPSLPKHFGTNMIASLVVAAVSLFMYPETHVIAANSTGIQPTEFTVVQNPVTILNSGLRYEEAVKADTFNRGLEEYLTKYKSPFVNHIETLRKQPEMKRILAISFVESNMGKRCYYYNCSGITLRTGKLKKYASYDEWIIDLNDLLQRRYNGWQYKDMLGVYVVPGSQNWLRGTTKVHAELDALEATSLALHQQHIAKVTAELASLK